MNTTCDCAPCTCAPVCACAPDPTVAVVAASDCGCANQKEACQCGPSCGCAD